jgi:uroporphyrinogen-III synthase
MGETSILVIRADDAFSSSLRAAGFNVTNLPLIGTKPLEDQSGLTKILRRLSEYDGIFFTSPAAAEVFVNAAGSSAAQPRIFAMGGRSRELLERAGYAVDAGKRGNTAAEFVASFEESEISGKRLLFVRGNRSLLTVPNLLKDRAQVEEVVVYETIENIPNEDVQVEIRTRLEAGEFEWACFFSPSGVETFCKLFGKKYIRRVAVIGTTTAAAVEQQGLTANFISPRSSALDFSTAFATYVNGN